MNAKEMYQCGNCEKVYETHNGALDCCEPEVFWAYKCGQCGQVWEDRVEAEDCCADIAQKAGGE